MNAEQMITNFVRDQLKNKIDPSTLNSQTSLVHSGLVDSVGVISLVVFLEENFNVDLMEFGFNPGDFDTIENIVKIATTKN